MSLGGPICISNCHLDFASSSLGGCQLRSEARPALSNFCRAILEHGVFRLACQPQTLLGMLLTTPWDQMDPLPVPVISYRGGESRFRGIELGSARQLVGAPLLKGSLRASSAHLLLRNTPHEPSVPGRRLIRRGGRRSGVDANCDPIGAVRTFYLGETGPGNSCLRTDRADVC
jgi:hypothetical protein